MDAKMMDNMNRGRNLDLGGIKVFSAVAGLAVTVALWSLFADQDRAAALNAASQAADPANNASAQLTLGDLRYVSPPAQSQFSSNSGPLQLFGNRTAFRTFRTRSS